MRSRPARVYLDDRRPAVKTQNGLGWGAAGAADFTATGGTAHPDRQAGSAAQSRDRGFRGRHPRHGHRRRFGHAAGRVRDPGAGARRRAPGRPDQRACRPPGANRTVYQSLAAPEVQFLAMPDGAPELRVLTDTDLNGNFVMASGARDDAGCYPTVTFDFRPRSRRQQWMAA